MPEKFLSHPPHGVCREPLTYRLSIKGALIGTGHYSCHLTRVLGGLLPRSTTDRKKNFDDFE